jgi:hypothetical protein
MNYRYSNHAIEQMKARNISQEIVDAIIEKPLQIILEDDKKIFHGIIEEENIKYLIRIFVNRMKQPNLIITVYKTSKIDKYYEGKI